MHNYWDNDIDDIKENWVLRKKGGALKVRWVLFRSFLKVPPPGPRSDFLSKCCFSYALLPLHISLKSVLQNALMIWQHLRQLRERMRKCHFFRTIGLKVALAPTAAAAAPPFRSFLFNKRHKVKSPSFFYSVHFSRFLPLFSFFCSTGWSHHIFQENKWEIRNMAEGRPERTKVW